MKKLLVLGSLVVGALAYPNCAMCHAGSMSLSNQTPAQIEAKLVAMKKAHMGGTMGGIVSSMSYEEIKEAAKIYGKK